MIVYFNHNRLGVGNVTHVTTKFFYVFCKMLKTRGPNCYDTQFSLVRNLYTYFPSLVNDKTQHISIVKTILSISNIMLF